jgi:hypothetical protein
MRVGIKLQVCLAATSMLIACGGGEAPRATATPPAAATAAPPSAVAPAPGGEFGVPECDAYIKAYTECVASKVPEAARAQMQAALDQSKQAWQAAASSSEGKAGLSAACRQAQDAARMSMQAYGCTF